MTSEVNTENEVQSREYGENDQLYHVIRQIRKP